MPLQQITPPTAEPLSLIEAKTHLRVLTSDTSEDTLIKALIAAARQYCELKTQSQIMASRWKLVMDAFPGPSLMGVPAGVPYSLPGHAVLIPRGQVLQVVSIQYTAMDGTLTTMPSSDYVVDTSSTPARITPVFGKIWPIPLPQIGSVQITFDAGFAAPITAVDTTADTITVPGWKTLAVNDTLRLSKRDKTAVNDGALPAPLAEYTDYYVQSVPGTNVYKLSATSGGGAIDITAQATGGDQFVGVIPEALKSWMLLAVGTLYENRESVSIDQRLSIAELPIEFLDGLLDPYRLMIY